MAKQITRSSEAASLHQTLSRPMTYLVRMLMFLILAGFGVAILYEQILIAYFSNPVLNSLILGALLIGVMYAFRQVLRLFPEIRWVNALRISEPGLAMQRQPTLLAPLANMLRDRRGQLSLSTGTMRSIMDSLGSRLDEARDTSRYLVGLLIFLGLLGTFWGLLETIQSVGRTINSLGTGGSASGDLFNELKTGLQAPLQGMGTAFSSSLFGLAGSLTLGFLELQANQAQNRFYNELEEFLSSSTELGPVTGAANSVPAQLRYAIVDMQRSIVDLGEKFQAQPAQIPANEETGQAVKELSLGIEKLVNQMRNEQKIVREWVDEQASQQHELISVLRDLQAFMKQPRR